MSMSSKYVLGSCLSAILAAATGCSTHSNPAGPGDLSASTGGVDLGGGGGPGTSPFQRIVLGRIYEQSQWTLRSASSGASLETPDSVGQALARLRPTYVSGLL